jgi:cyclomaltodextrinase / maltogenic alpha-amylase / neopullulanase
MAWPEHTIWWQLHPISFTGAEPIARPAGRVAASARSGDRGVPGGRPPGLAQPAEPAERAGHRLRRIESWLDYLIELGCNGLALGPVFASESHGYDTVDHFRIDPRLGSGADFDHLVRACRDRGIRLLLDGVLNHVGRGFPAFQDVLSRGAASQYASWFRLDFTAGGPDGFGYADFEGHRGLVALNHAEPAVQDYATAVLNHWLDRGADGWRLDAAYAVPTAFWPTVIGRVRREHPGAWFVGEMIHGDYAAAIHDGGLDSVTQYELWKAIWSSLNDGNFFELAWALDRHNGFLAEFLPLTFVGNHDVTRLASRLTDPRYLAHAVLVLLTVGGVPSIYAGDEQAFRGMKFERADGDAEIRPEFPASPGDLAPDGWPVYRLHQDLIGLRRRHSWLARSVTKVRHLASQALAYHAVDPDGGPGLTVLLNTSATAVDFPLPGAPGKRLLASTQDDHGQPYRVEPHGWAIVEPPAGPMNFWPAGRQNVGGL